MDLVVDRLAHDAVLPLHARVTEHAIVWAERRPPRILDDASGVCVEATHTIIILRPFAWPTTMKLAPSRNGVLVDVSHAIRQHRLLSRLSTALITDQTRPRAMWRWWWH